MRATILCRKAPLLWIVAILCTTMGLTRTQSADVSAAAMTVDSTIDAVDANLDDGVCATSTGACTLRAALQEANGRSGPDTIILPPGTYTLTLRGDDDQAVSGDLDITDDVTIVGAGQTATVIDGGRIDRVFETWKFSTVVAIGHLTIRNGYASDNDGINDGGGLLTRSQTRLDSLTISHNEADGDGAGIFVAEGNLILTSVTVSGNSTYNEEYGAGGGIANRGALTLNSSIVDDNTAWDGAGISNDGVLIFNNSAVRSNNTHDGNGGGISNGGKAILTNSSVSDNRSDGADGGGGILNGGSMALDYSTVSGNGSGNRGGGILNWNAGVLEITNSTISHNTSTGDGGGLATWGKSVRLDSSTITDNTGGTVGGITNTGSGTLTIQHTIVAGNRGGSTPDCSGSLISQGYNLIGNASGCGFAASTGDLVGTSGRPIDPKLGPLQHNDGPTLTHALLPDSPAIDAGDNTTCPASDQRWYVRPAGLACDIGAVEWLAHPRRLYLPMARRAPSD